MCGIAGILSKNKLLDKDIHLFNNLLDKINHRGPDDRGTYIDKKICIGNNRLSIIDEKGGKQPFYSPDGKLILVYNGEIYNYNYLKNKFFKSDKFKSYSDTELLILGYEKYGTKFFSELNGIFAFAIWDTKSSELIICRDPLGIKPFYYFEDENNFYFSSEIKSFLNCGIKTEVNQNAVLQYLSSGYIFNTNSIIKNIFQLSPGTFKIINNQFQIIESNYNAISFSNRKYTNINSNINTKIHDSFIKAVDRQLISDFPVGLFLSSGVDSMSILSSLKKLNKLDQINTYTAFYNNKEYSEHQPVKELSEKYGFKNNQIFITPEDVHKKLEKVFFTFDNLDFLPISVTKYILCERASQQNKVLLAGVGGDELFMGYPTYKASLILKYLPKNLFFLKILKKYFFKNYKSNSNLGFQEKLNRFIISVLQNKNYSHLLWRHIFILKELSVLLKDKNINFEDIYEEQIKIYDNLNIQLNNQKDILSIFDIKTWVLDHGLKAWDKAGMAHSVEVRVPFLDTEFLNVVMKIPTEVRAPNIGSKYALRNNFLSEFPKNIISKNKKGFRSPVVDWINYKKTKDLFKDLTFSIDKEFINSSKINNIWDDFERGYNNAALKIWMLACFQGYLKTHNLQIK